MQAGSTPEMQDYFSDLTTPNPADMQVQLEELVLQGSLSPEQAQAIMQDPSALNAIMTDPTLKTAQYDALRSLQDIGETGMTDMDRAALAKISTDEATQSRGAREAIIQNAQARGMGGSGLEILSQLQNAQDSATRKSARDTEVAGMAQERALQALQQAGTQAGQMQAQDFGQKAQVAGANDAIAQFNAANKQNVALTNTAANNEAQARNLAAKQSIADANTGTRNTQQQYNKNLIQQNFDNELKKRGGQSNVASANQQAAGQNSQNQANATNQTIGTGLTAAAMFMSDEREKEDVEDFDASAFLDSLTAKKYKYKDQMNGAGPQAGVIAQDLEKTPEGSSAVVNTSKGKMVDAGKASNLALAGLADLHKRMRSLEGEE